MPTATLYPTPLNSYVFELIDVEAGVSVLQWLKDSGMYARMQTQPIVIYRNGEELLEESWGDIIDDADVFSFSALPQATALQVAWYVVLSIVSNPSFWVFVATVALSYLTRPKFDDPNPTGSNYNLTIRGNRARLGAPKPVLFGTFLLYPDYSALPFVEFDANGEENWTLLYELSVGEVSVDTDTMRFEDTLLSNFQDVVYEVLDPGEQSTLYPSQVVTSGEVSGIELTTTHGPYAANASGTQITGIGVDIIAPRGLFRSRSSGGQDRINVEIRVEAREIDDSGTPLGAYASLGTRYLSGDSATPIRRTFYFQVTAARYEVRVVRVTADSGGAKIVDELLWGQLRGYIADSLPAPESTRLAIRVRSSNQIGSRALGKFNVICTRKLRQWSTGGGWAAPSTTNSIAWAFAEVATADYAGKRDDAFVDLAGLETFDAGLPSGFECNGFIDVQMTVWDALQRVAQCAIGSPVDPDGVLRVVRDVSQPTPVQMFNMRNIVRGTFSIQSLFFRDDTPDYLIVEFYDEDQGYRLTEVDCILPGGTSNTPQRERLWGVTNSDQAWEIGMFMAAENKLRRALVEFETGLESRIPSYKETVLVSHLLVGQEGFDQISADVTAYDGTDTLTLTESGLTGRFSTPYIVLRDLEGAPRGPYTCSVIADNQIQITDAQFVTDGDSYIVFDSDYERPKVSVGEGVDFSATIKITEIEPVGEHRFRVRGFIDALSVYTITNGETPAAAQTLPDLAERVPTVSDLVAKGDGSTTEPIVILTWEGENSDRYDIEYSTDGGTTWIDANGAANTVGERFIDRPGVIGAIQYRVAGITAYRGPWATISINTNTLIDDTIKVPEIIDSLTIYAGNEIIEGRAVIAVSSTNLPPTEVEIWRVTGPDTKYADGSLVLIATVPMAYDATNDQFIGLFSDASVVGGNIYYYFATARNIAGAAADHYPTGTNDGVTVTPHRVGATAGTDLRNEAGDVLADIDVRNDQLVTKALNGLNQNPGFEIPRVNPLGAPGPAGWWGYGSANAAAYVDPDERDLLLFAGGTGLNVASSMIPIEPGADYEIRCLARKTDAGDATTLNLFARYLTSDPAAGEIAVGPASFSGAGSDPSAIFAAQDGNTSGTTHALTTSFAIYTKAITFGPTVTWASIILDVANNAGAAGNVEIEWCVLRSLATTNTGALADQDDVDFATQVTGAEKPANNATNNTGALADEDSVSQFQIDLYAAHRVAAEATAAGISLEGTGYVTIEDVSITLPASVTDSVVQVDCHFSVLGIGAGGEAGLSQFYQTMAVRLLDEDDAVVQTDVLYLPYFRNTSGSSSVRIAADAYTYTFYVPAANLNAGVSNTFKLQIDRDVTSNWSSLTAFQRNIRATLLNQAES